MKIEKCQDMLLSDITNLYLIPNQAKDKFFSSYPLVYKKGPVYLYSGTGGNLHY